MKIKIKITKKAIYTLIGLLTILALGIAVYAIIPPKPFTGHNPEEIMIEDGDETSNLTSYLESHDIGIGSAETFQGDGVDPVEGFERKDCHILVTMEDSHYGSPARPYNDWSSDDWEDDGHWKDNGYGGMVNYAHEYSGIDAWAVQCRYGISTKDGDNPAWQNGKCKYLMVCTKG